jgi:hypothetical protein
MLTLFSTPRPFKGPFDRIQRNAIKSWKAVCPNCQIILFEDEEGTTSKVAEELQVLCIKDRQSSEFGTPLLSSLFTKAKEFAENKIIVQISTDMILTDKFLPAVERIVKMMDGKPFLMAGRRWDLDFNDEIDFTKKDWQVKLMEQVGKNGKLHGHSAMDYWVMPCNLPIEFPPFVIGRPGTDSWLVYKLRSMKIPVIDSTNVIDIIHQNHNYPQKSNPFFAVEKANNMELAGGFMNMLTLREANWLFTEKGLIKPKFPERIFSELALFYPWRLLLLIKRKIDILLKRW